MANDLLLLTARSMWDQVRYRADRADELDVIYDVIDRAAASGVLSQDDDPTWDYAVPTISRYIERLTGNGSPCWVCGEQARPGHTWIVFDEAGYYRHNTCYFKEDSQ